MLASETDTGKSGTLMLHLLGRCNLTCRHCYMQGAPSRRERLSLRSVLEAIEDCETLGIAALYLTGGEPLLYRDLPTVLDAAASVPGLETTVCTNGTLLMPRHTALFARLGLRLNVSIDGEPAFHDEFRNSPGAFRATERGIRAAVADGVYVSIITTVSRWNVLSVSAVVDWAVRMGVRAVRFQPLLKLGRGLEIADQRLTPAELDRLILEVSDLANRYRGQLTCNLIGQNRRYLLAHPCAAYVCNGTGCHRRVARELKKIVVREDGIVLPEATNLDPAFALGHIEDARLTVLVSRFLDDNYERFDQLCRTTYATVMPAWESAIVPWDEILAESSHHLEKLQKTVLPDSVGCNHDYGINAFR